MIAQALSGGVDWAQIREKDLPGAALLALAGEAVAEAKGHSRILMNDRLDVAMAARAGGVHLGETSLPVAQVAAWIREARAAGHVEKDFLVGASCHSPESARRRSGLHFLRAGVCHAIESCIRRASGARTSSRGLRRPADPGSGHRRNYSGKRAAVHRGRRCGDRRNSAIPERETPRQRRRGAASFVNCYGLPPMMMI